MNSTITVARKITRNEFAVEVLTFDGVRVSDTVVAYNEGDAKGKVRNMMRANHGQSHVTILSVKAVA